MPGILSVLSPAPFVFVALFLLLSPVSKLVLPDEEISAATGAGGSTPVVVVVFDEFSGSTLTARDGGVDGQRFPNFARAGP